VTVEPEQIETSAEIEVWDVNWPIVVAFLDVTTQWRAIAGLGGVLWLGLDYVALDVVLRRRGDLGDELFELIRIMEQAALPVLNERTDG